jgi:hypothetical protein
VGLQSRSPTKNEDDRQQLFGAPNVNVDFNSDDKKVTAAFTELPMLSAHDTSGAC